MLITSELAGTMFGPYAARSRSHQQDPQAIAGRDNEAGLSASQRLAFAGMSHQPDNIFAGTQVAALAEVRGPGNSLVHPRGAVGVVTRTPTGEMAQAGHD